MNVVSLFVFLILFLFGNSTALNENGVKDHFYILSKAFADQISKEHRTTEKRVDFTNGDEIHHRR